MQTFTIDSFDPNDMVENGHYAIIGKRGSGKSWAIRHSVHIYGNKKK